VSDSARSLNPVQPCISWHKNADYSKRISSASPLSRYTYKYQTVHERISCSSPTQCITRSPAIADNLVQRLSKHHMVWFI